MTINIKELIKEIKDNIKRFIDQGGKRPSLLILQVGDNEASNRYINGKISDCGEVGISATHIRFDGNVAEEEIAYNIRSFLESTESRFDGIILQEPSYLNQEDKDIINELISREKDVDGFLQDSLFTPCTPKGIIRILKYFHSNLELESANCLIIGRGELVGEPLAKLLTPMMGSVTICGSKVKDLESLIDMADIIISATGKADLINKELMDGKHGKFIIDAGIAFKDGKICGDVSKELYEKESPYRIGKANYYTTVPGGVGLMTRAMLLENVLNAAYPDWTEVKPKEKEFKI